jgi:hypothetical protein
MYSDFAVGVKLFEAPSPPLLPKKVSPRGHNTPPHSPCHTLCSALTQGRGWGES